MSRLKQLASLISSFIPKPLITKKNIARIGVISLVGLGALTHYCKKNELIPEIFKAFPSSTIRIPINKNTNIIATKINPENMKLLRKTNYRRHKFVQFINGPIKLHPHYFYYRKTLLIHNKPIPKLYLINLNHFPQHNILFNELGLNEKQLKANKDTLNYALIDYKGNIIYSTDKMPIDPVKHGVVFLEGPVNVNEEESLVSLANGTDGFEHTFFVIYDDHKKSALINSFYKLFAELSYNLQQICTFIVIHDPKLAKDLKMDISQPGVLHVLNIINRLNVNSFNSDDNIVVNMSRFAITKCPLFDHNEKHAIIKEFDKIFNTLKEYVIQVLCYKRSIQYCPNVDYLKLYLSLYQERKDSVLYVAVNPSLITMEDFELLYDNLSELHKNYSNIRIVLTDAPDAANYSWILPGANEKITIRFIDYARGYQRTEGKVKFGLISELTKVKGRGNYIEKYRLQSNEVPSTEAFKKFIKDCREHQIDLYNETDVKDEKQMRLTGRNYKEVLKREINKDRVVLCYCTRCAKCKQVLDTINNNSILNNIYTYNIANESDLNSWINTAPSLVLFNKGSITPSKIKPLTNIIVGKNADKEIINEIFNNN